MLCYHSEDILNTLDYFPPCHLDIKTNNELVMEAQKMPKGNLTRKTLGDLQKVQNNAGLPLYCCAQAWPSLNILRNSNPILCGPPLNQP